MLLGVAVVNRVSRTEDKVRYGTSRSAFGFFPPISFPGSESSGDARDRLLHGSVIPHGCPRWPRSRPRAHYRPHVHRETFAMVRVVYISTLPSSWWPSLVDVTRFLPRSRVIHRQLSQRQCQCQSVSLPVLPLRYPGSPKQYPSTASTRPVPRPLPLPRQPTGTSLYRPSQALKLPSSASSSSETWSPVTYNAPHRPKRCRSCRPRHRSFFLRDEPSVLNILQLIIYNSPSSSALRRPPIPTAQSLPPCSIITNATPLKFLSPLPSPTSGSLFSFPFGVLRWRGFLDNYPL